VRRQPGGGTFHIEDVQDQVELALMRSGDTTWPAPTCCTAPSTWKSAARQGSAGRRRAAAPQLNVLDNGERRRWTCRRARLINAACAGLEKHVDADAILPKP
jgi:ribonucleoside-diphosphate reductase alpha chain